MHEGIEIVLPKSFEEYDDLGNFMEDAQVFTNTDKAVEYWKDHKQAVIFNLELSKWDLPE